MQRYLVGGETGIRRVQRMCGEFEGSGLVREKELAEV